MMFDDLIERKFELHDRFQFEVKLDYNLGENEKSDRYTVETYFFIPSSFKIHADNYTKSDFYNDMTGYIRLKTPSISLRKLIDPTVTTSPLAQLTTPLEAILSGDRNPVLLNQGIHDLKMFGCVIKANVRDEVSYLLSQADRLDAEAQTSKDVVLSDVIAIATGLVKDISAALVAYRNLKQRVMHSITPTALKETYEYVNEYSSIVTDEYLTLAARELEQRLAIFPALSHAVAVLKDQIIFEVQYRKGSGYAVLEPDGSNGEGFVFRKGALKKFISSVLYLEVSRRDTTDQWQDYFYSIGAGVAMLFAVVVTIWAQMRWGMDSFPFIFVAVVSYMFKDRIKDWCKAYFNTKMTQWFADHTIRIIDPTQNHEFAVCREAVTFIDPGSVPREVTRARAADQYVLMEEAGRAERILKYAKEIQIRRKEMLAVSPHLRSINDILRYNVSRFMSKLDDPETRVFAVSTESRAIMTYRCSKVYHLNVIFRFVTHDDRGRETEQIEKLRVVLDQHGIQRLEKD